MQTRQIGKTNVKLTEFGLGGAPLANLYLPLPENIAHQTVIEAWKAGVRYFDTAPYYGYGLSEIRLGKFLLDYPREEYVISTKVGRLLNPDSKPKMNDPFPESLPYSPSFDYSYDGIMRSIEESLKRLNLAYIDIALVHDIGRLTHGDRHDYFLKMMLENGYRALEELRSQKVIHAIGLGVNEWEVCMEAMPFAHFDCFMLAGRYTLLEQTALECFFPECMKRNISVIAAGPFNSGILAQGPESNQRYNYALADNHILNRVKQIQEICKQFDVELSHAAIHFPLLHPQVVSVVAGLRSPQELWMAANHLKNQLPIQLWEKLKEEELLASHAPVFRMS